MDSSDLHLWRVIWNLFSIFLWSIDSSLWEIDQVLCTLYCSQQEKYHFQSNNQESFDQHFWTNIILDNCIQLYSEKLLFNSCTITFSTFYYPSSKNTRSFYFLNSNQNEWVENHRISGRFFERCWWIKDLSWRKGRRSIEVEIVYKRKKVHL